MRERWWRPWLGVLLLSPLLAAPADAQTDTRPPVVTSFAFDRNEYVAGTNVQVRFVVEDRDKVNAVSFLLQAPGGRLHPSATCGRIGGNDTAPLYACQTPTPHDARQGTYVVHSVNVTDGAGRKSQLVAGTNALKEGPNVTLQVQVLTFVDTQPPELRGVQFSSPTVPRGGTVRVNVTGDDPSGIDAVRVRFDGPENSTPLETSCTGGRDRASCVLSVPRTALVGVYYLFQVELTDGRGQAATFFRDVDFRAGPTTHVELNVTLGFNDTSKPVLQAYRMPAEPVRRGQRVAVELDAADNVQVAAVELHFESLHGKAELELRECTGLGNRTVKARCSAVVPDTHPLGRSRLATIVLRDLVGNEHRQTVAEPSPTAAIYATLLRQMTFTVLPGTLRTNGGSGEGMVDGLLPAVPNTAPGRVVPVVVAEGVPLQNVSFRFTGPGGSAILGVEDCSATRRPLPGGFECLVYVPPDALRGEYRLTKLRAQPRGEDWTPVDVNLTFSPRLAVTDAPRFELDRLPVGFGGQLADGLTKAGVNTVALPDPTPEPVNTITPPKRGTPLPVATLLAALAVALVLRRPGRQ